MVKWRPAKPSLSSAGKAARHRYPLEKFSLSGRAGAPTAAGTDLSPGSLEHCQRTCPVENFSVLNANFLNLRNISLAFFREVAYKCSF
jgi:hypothetical protein